MKKSSLQERWDNDRRATLEVLQGKRPIWRDDGKDWLGHTRGAADMDVMLLKGTTVAAVMKETTRKLRTSFHRHKNTLQTKHGLRVTRKGNVYQFDLESILAALGLAASPTPDASSKPHQTVAFEAAKLGSSYFSPDPPIDERPRALQETHGARGSQNSERT